MKTAFQMTKLRVLSLSRPGGVRILLLREAYIKCSPCCVDDGIVAAGVHGDALEKRAKHGGEL